jgi:dihydrofolate reductase
MIKIIVSISKNWVIGRSNSMIWNLSEDLKRFRRLTIGHTVVMGRKTYQSIGKPLDGRRNIIISRNFQSYGCEVVNSLQEALKLCNNNCFIIGGGEIYKQSIGIAQKLYLTLIDKEFDGDTYFPEIGQEWKEVNREDFNNPYKYSFIDYEKR